MNRADLGNSKCPFRKGQSALSVFFKNLCINKLVDPEIDDALLSDAENGDHLGVRWHPAVGPEEGDNEFLNRSCGAFFFHDSLV